MVWHERGSRQQRKSSAAQSLSLSTPLARATLLCLLARGSLVVPFLAARSRLRMLSDRIEIANSGRHTLLTRECFGLREPPVVRGDLQLAPQHFEWGEGGPFRAPKSLVNLTFT